MSDNELKVLITAQNDQLKTGMAEVTNTVNGAIAQMTSSFSGMNSSFGNIAEAIKGHFVGIAASITAAFSVKGIKEALSATEEYASGVRKLVNMMGLTAEAASALSAGLQIAGISVDEYVAANMRLLRQLKANEGKFEALGIEVRDANTNAFLPQPKIFENIIEKMKEYKSGTDQIMFAMDVLGPRGADLAFKFLRLKEAQEMATPIMQALNMEMGYNGVQAAKQYELQVNALAYAFTVLKVKIGMELMPQATGLAAMMRDVIVPSINIVIETLKGLYAAMTVFGTMAIELGLSIYGPLKAITDLILGILSATLKVGTGDFKGAWKALVDAGNIARDTMRTTGEAMVGEARTAYNAIKSLYTDSPFKGGAPAKPGTKEYVSPKEEKGTDKEAKSRLPEWKDELEQMKMDNKIYYQDSSEMDRAFWDKKLILAKGNAKEIIAVNHQLYELDKKSAKEAFDIAIDAQKTILSSEKSSAEQKAAAEKKVMDLTKAFYQESSAHYAKAKQEDAKVLDAFAKKEIENNIRILDSKLKSAESAIQVKEIETNTLAQLGVISSKKEIEITRQLNEQIYALSLERYTNELALEWERPGAYAKVLDKIKELNDKHNVDMAKSDQKMILEQHKTWTSITGAIRNAFTQSIQGIMQGTTTLKQAFQNLATSILSSLANVFIEIGLKWAEQQVKMLLGIGEKTAAETAAAATTMATKSTEAATVVPLEAAEAGGGAAAAVAGIPFVGPILAIAAMAAVFGAVMGLMSAEQGWDVDKGGLTMIHDKEMVLPSHLAEGVRNMTARGGGGGGGNVTFNVNAFDSKDVGAFFKKHGSVIANSLKGPQRSFQLNTVLGRR